MLFRSALDYQQAKKIYINAPTKDGLTQLEILYDNILGWRVKTIGGNTEITISKAAAQILINELENELKIMECEL